MTFSRTTSHLFAISPISTNCRKASERLVLFSTVLSFASGAIEGAAAGERELTPKEVLTELFTEELHPDPEWMATRVIEHLRDFGFVILPVAGTRGGTR